MKSNYPSYFPTLNSIHEYIHYPLPQATPRYHKTHKESFVKEVGFIARGGADLKERALFQVSEPVWRKYKIRSGKIKHREV